MDIVPIIGYYKLTPSMRCFSLYLTRSMGEAREEIEKVVCNYFSSVTVKSCFEDDEDAYNKSLFKKEELNHDMYNRFRSRKSLKEFCDAIVSTSIYVYVNNINSNTHNFIEFNMRSNEKKECILTRYYTRINFSLNNKSMSVKEWNQEQQNYTFTILTTEEECINKLVIIYRWFKSNKRAFLIIGRPVVNNIKELPELREFLSECASIHTQKL